MPPKKKVVQKTKEEHCYEGTRSLSATIGRPIQLTSPQTPSQMRNTPPNPPIPPHIRRRRRTKRGNAAQTKTSKALSELQRLAKGPRFKPSAQPSSPTPQTHALGHCSTQTTLNEHCSIIIQKSMREASEEKCYEAILETCTQHKEEDGSLHCAYR